MTNVWKNLWNINKRPGNIKKRTPKEEVKAPRCVSDWFSLSPAVQICLSLAMREGGDGGEAGAAPPPLLCHGGLLLHRRLPLHLSFLHLHSEGPGNPHRQVGHQGVYTPRLCWVGWCLCWSLVVLWLGFWLCCVVMLRCGVEPVWDFCALMDKTMKTGQGVGIEREWFVA